MTAQVPSAIPDLSYVNYHRHSCVSNILLTDSVATNEDYAKRAVELGHTILSTCEHGNQGMVHQCSALAEKYGLHWRYVCEAYFVKDRHDKDNTNCHIILAAKTRKGVGDLNMVLSEANISGYYYRPRVDMELLLSLDPRDVFVTTACIAGMFKYGLDEAEKLILRLAAHFRGSFMLEVQYHDTDKQRELNRFLLGLYHKHGIPLIMGTDSHFIYPEDAELRNQRLEANHIHYEDEEGWWQDYPSGQEAFRRFQAQGVLSDAQIREAMENTNIFLTFEDVTFDKSKKLPTIYPDLTQEERDQLYLKLVNDAFESASLNMSDAEKSVRQAGVQYETDVIVSTGMADYFLLDHEIVKRAKEKGGVITKTGRGSGPSYYTNTLLGLSSIDRFSIPVEMFPDRFISADRIISGSLPDIDMNVSNREAFEDAQAELLGEWRSAPMVAFGTLKRLSAWKMYCRANNVPFEIANRIADSLKQYEQDMRYASEEDADDINVYDYVPGEYQELVTNSERYMGLIDNISPHPCAYLLCTEDIRREIGIIRINSKGGKKKTVYAAFIDGTTAEQFGYLKNDLLLVSVVKINQEAYARAGLVQPDVNELLRSTDGDQDTWRMYADGLTMGLNQVEQPKTREKVMQYKPRNITELSAFVAAVRPAFKSMLPVFLARQHFDYGIPAFDQLIQTKDMTSSFILFQEQTMKTLQYAGFSAPESYAAIKAIAKKHPEKVLPLKERFMTNFGTKTDERSAEKVWQIIEDATSYGFNCCLSGNTRIKRGKNRKTGGFYPTIAEMYRIRNDPDYAKATGHTHLSQKYRLQGYGTALSLFEDGRIHRNTIVDIRYSGYRDTYRLTTESGASIVCTDNHKFPTANGTIMLKDLKVGDSLYLCGTYTPSSRSYSFTNGIFERNYPSKGQCGFQKTRGPSVLFNETRAEYAESAKACEVCGKPYAPDQRFELHHVDGDRYNNTVENFQWCCVSCHKKAHYRLGRTRQQENGYPALSEVIVSIEYVGQEDVYDVEMAAPAHNFVVDSGLITSNSHAVSVALDSLYGAYLKAHYPLEYYTTLLSNYAEKGDKERIALAKDEMRKGFGISVAACRFRQDNRDFYIDHASNTISDALTSVKHVSKRVASALYGMRDNLYTCFTDLLYDMEIHPAFDSQVVEILIRLDYFREFGMSGKLQKLYQSFRNGEFRFSKTHVSATQQKRLAILRNIEAEMPDESIPPHDLLRFEIEHCGTPVSIFPQMKDEYAVLEVDDRYSPKVRLYNVATGRTGVMKLKKAAFKAQPLEIGSILKLLSWERKPSYKFVGGKAKPRSDTFDLWITQYRVLT